MILFPLQLKIRFIISRRYLIKLPGKIIKKYPKMNHWFKRLILEEYKAQ